MRPVVALLQSRPETVIEDYVRLLDLLSGFTDLPASEIIIAAKAGNKEGPVGQTCPPWQLDGCVHSLTAKWEDPTELSFVAVKKSGVSVKLPQSAQSWKPVLERSNLSLMSEQNLVASPYRPITNVPALVQSLAGGLSFSPHFEGKRLVLLSTLELENSGQLEAGVSGLCSLLAPEKKSFNKVPGIEVKAELVQLAQEVFSSIHVVCDLTVMSIQRNGSDKVPLIRNILVAGNDPIAVDSVLAKMVGLSPAQTPWHQLCQNRQAGTSDLDRINILGEPELLDLDFQIPEDTFASGGAHKRWLPGALWNRLTGRSSGSDNSSTNSSWAGLFRDYCKE